MPKLTKRTVDALQPDPSRRLFVADDELAGFGVRVTPQGAKSYIVEYRPGAGGRKAPKRRVTIGRHGSPWTVDAARAEARRLLALVAGGADPASEKAEARKGPGADQTFAAVARRFLDRQRTEIRPKTGRPLRAKTLADYRGIVEGKLIPAWGERDVAGITRRDVARLVDGVADTAPVMARLTFAVARVLFGWCVERHLIETNPCDGMKGPASPKARQRTLDDDEVRLLWQATAGGGAYDVAVRLLLLTGQRQDEVAAATWAEVDIAKALWRLDGGRTKNGEPHEVDLAPAALAELDKLDQRQRQALTANGRPPTARDLAAFRRIEPFLFGRAPLSNWSRSKRTLDARLAELAEAEGRDPMPAWRFHDLRRTCATGMQRLGFGVEVIERCLNHVSGTRSGLVGTYQTADLRDRRKAASLAWAAHVERVVAGGGEALNVVELRPGGG